MQYNGNFIVNNGVPIITAGDGADRVRPNAGKRYQLWLNANNFTLQFDNGTLWKDIKAYPIGAYTPAGDGFVISDYTFYNSVFAGANIATVRWFGSSITGGTLSISSNTGNDGTVSIGDVYGTYKAKFFEATGNWNFDGGTDQSFRLYTAQAVKFGNIDSTGVLKMPATGTNTATSINFGTAGTGFYGAAAALYAAISGTLKMTLNATNATFAVGVSGTFFSISGNTVIDASGAALQIGTSGSYTSITLAKATKFGGPNATGSGVASLGSNCPAVTATAPYTWIQAFSNDGSTVYIPCYK
jgi:hypothetical protein